MKKPLTNLQKEILQSFNYSVSEDELTAFRKMLTNYFANKITDDVDQLFEKKGWDDKKSDNWALTHMRTPYNGQNSA